MLAYAQFYCYVRKISSFASSYIVITEIIATLKFDVFRRYHISTESHDEEMIQLIKISTRVLCDWHHRCSVCYRRNMYYT